MIDGCAKSGTSKSWVSLYWGEVSKTRGMLQFILTGVVDNMLVYLLEPSEMKQAHESIAKVAAL